MVEQLIDEYTIQFPIEQAYLAVTGLTDFDNIEWRKTYRQEDFTESESGVGTLILYLRVEALW